MRWHYASWNLRAELNFGGPRALAGACLQRVSSSIRFAAGLSGFFSFSQRLDRPLSYGRSFLGNGADIFKGQAGA